jgi:hypothetical protein
MSSQPRASPMGGPGAPCGSPSDTHPRKPASTHSLEPSVRCRIALVSPDVASRLVDDAGKTVVHATVRNSKNFGLDKRVRDALAAFQNARVHMPLRTVAQTHQLEGRRVERQPRGQIAPVGLEPTSSASWAEAPQAINSVLCRPAGRAERAPVVLRVLYGPDLTYDPLHRRRKHRMSLPQRLSAKHHHPRMHGRGACSARR